MAAYVAKYRGLAAIHRATAGLLFNYKKVKNGKYIIVQKQAQQT